jgi:hypothetical protein
MKLRGGQGTVLDGRQERHVMLRPREACVVTALPLLRGVGVHEVEPRVGVQTAEERTARRCVDDVPPHVRDDRSIQPDDGAGPLCAAFALHPELDSAGEQDLHADADPQDGMSLAQSLGDDLVTTDRAQTDHARLVGADAGNH